MYCDYLNQANQTTLHILGSIVKQLINAVSEYSLSMKIFQYLKEIRKNDLRLQMKDVTALLELLSPHFDKIFLCIDALDELTETTRDELLSFLNMHMVEKCIFFTGRPHVAPDVDSVFSLGTEDVITVQAHEEDIRTYIKHRITQDKKKSHAMNPALQQEMVDVLPSQSKGM